MIKRPMKAPGEPITDEQLQQIKYPVYGSAKLDGFRATVWDKVYTSSMKLLPNLYVQNCLSNGDYNGLDGELIVGRYNDPNAFNNTTGPLRRRDGEPDFTFYVFDDFTHPTFTYATRWLMANDFSLPRVVILEQRKLNSPQEVIDFEIECLTRGFEGAMIRSPDAPYKEGRATFREQYIFKRKPTEDAEGIVIDFEEQMENCNEATTNEMGLTRRASNKENLKPKGTLGKFILKSDKWSETFGCGTGKGLTNELRQEIWNNKWKYLGKVVTFKYQPYGSIDKPRLPIYKGFRAPEDITKY